LAFSYGLTHLKQEINICCRKGSSKVRKKEESNNIIVADFSDFKLK